MLLTKEFDIRVQKKKEAVDYKVMLNLTIPAELESSTGTLETLLQSLRINRLCNIRYKLTLQRQNDDKAITCSGSNKSFISDINKLEIFTKYLTSEEFPLITKEFSKLLRNFYYRKGHAIQVNIPTYWLSLCTLHNLDFLQEDKTKVTVQHATF